MTFNNSIKLFNISPEVKTLTLMFILICSSSQVRADALLKLSGRLTSVTAKYYIVETPNAAYKVTRAAVAPQQAAAITKTEVPVTLSIPFEAIERVNSKRAPVTKD